ncbi:sulfurtransferase [Cyanobacterium aponinum UTEX 3222]|uniref:sulfurtransferase n=1 Tax=Cyanobacterium aponinum TaxID=379064 RepID=UPI003092B102|nr:sulfurtransferase [Cyanobacterium aponinum UTEX 3222]
MGSTQVTVSAQWLKDNLGRSDLKIIDCRFRLADSQWGYQEYQKSHIENAYYLDLNQDLSDVVQSHGGRHPLPKIDAFTSKLEEFGIIKGETTVIAYDDLRLAFSARLWWLLRYLGHDRIFILDGGWQEWQKLGYPVSNKIPDRVRGSFLPEIRSDLLVDKDYVESRLNFDSTIIIDARSGDRYRGEHEPIDPIAGSIPGAKNIFWQEMTTDDSFLKSKEELTSLWSSYLEYPEIILYCGSGVTACVNLLALFKINISQSKLYAGGWSDWCSYPEHFR